MRQLSSRSTCHSLRSSLRRRFSRFERLENRALLAAGDLDTTFGVGGKVTTDFSGTLFPGTLGQDVANDVAIQADGKIIAVGELTSAVSLDTDFAIARYNADGSLDNSFGNSGLVLTDFGSGSAFGQDIAWGVVIQADQKIVVIGYSSLGGNPNNFDFALARYESNGVLDTTFGVGGKVRTDFGSRSANDFAMDVAIQTDGKIVVGGTSDSKNSAGYEFAIARYDANGNLDPGFGSGGKTTTDFTQVPTDPDELGSGGDRVLDIEITDQGKIVAFGDSNILIVTHANAGSSGAGDFAGARYNADGSLDSAFGSGGKVVTPVSPYEDAAGTVEIQPDGKLVVAGFASTLPGALQGPGSELALVRYLSTGALDSSFGSGGIVRVSPADIIASAPADTFVRGGDLAVQPDGRIVLSSTLYLPDRRDLVVSRFNTDGSTDTGFGDNGHTIVQFAAGADYPSLAVQTDGKIVIVGSTSSNNGDFAIARLTNNAPPVANAGGPYTINEGGSLTLDGSQSSDPDGDALTYSWDVNGDGIFGDAVGVAPTLTWAQLNALGITDNATPNGAPRTQPVRLRVTDRNDQLIQNGSFESGRNAGGPAIGVGNTDIDGWEIISGTVDYINYWPTTDGQRSLDMVGVSPGGIRQSFSTQPGTTYEVQFSVGANFTSNPLFPILRVSAAGGHGDFSLTEVVQPYPHWQEKSWQFTAVDTTTALVFQALNGGVGGSTLDNVRVRALSSGGDGTDEASASLTVLNVAPVITSITTTELIENGSFELGQNAGGPAIGVGSTDVVGWEIISGTIDYIDYWPATDGQRSLDMVGVSPGGIRQSFSTQPGTTYEVQFSIGANYTANPLFPILRVSAAGVYGDFSLTEVVQPYPHWQEKSWQFTAVDTTTALVFQALNGGVRGSTLDNVRIRTADTINAPIEPIPVNTNVSASAPFTDVGTADTHTATWNWGDGGTSSGLITETNGSGTATGNHTYTSPGVYTLKLDVFDDDGGSDTAQFQYVVVYDPSAGFVTGGGWIDSPLGAYTADPMLTGKANFGFVSKYQQGTSIPDGQTQFQFKAGELNFHSTSYEWLVIAGANAKFKGEGTINGQGRYGFMLTATDGQANGGGGTDKFRIKLWDKNNADAVVYDNKLGAGDDTYDGTALGGGSIVLHKSGNPLTAAVSATSASPTLLTQPMLDAAVADAIAGWDAAGIKPGRLARLADIDFEIAQFTGATLGVASNSTNKIWLDVDGAGLGWSIDTGGYDLISAVSHEIGHRLGYDHDVLGEILGPGERYLASDQFHSRDDTIRRARLQARQSAALDALFEVSVDEPQAIGSRGGRSAGWRFATV